MFERGSSFSEVINKKTIHALGLSLKEKKSDFDLKGFLRDSEVHNLKFGERITKVCDALCRYLPGNFKESVDMLLACLPPEIPESQAGTTFPDHFIVMPMTEYIARNGLNLKNFQIAMNALRTMTQSFTSENAVRPFLIAYPEKTLAYLLKCTKHPSAHVRRLASEGTRPRLPLAKPLKSFIQEPRQIIPILEALKDDPHLYVRRSVANSLNDISKDHPDLVVDLLKKWQKNASKERFWIIRHALRTLAKKGHPQALALLGYKSANVEVREFKCTRSVRLGEDLEFSFKLKNKGLNSLLLIDYVITFKKKSSESEKVFKLKKIQANQNEELHMRGKRKIDHFSTRKMYPGKHAIALQVNGKRFEKSEFMVVEKSR